MIEVQYDDKFVRVIKAGFEIKFNFMLLSSIVRLLNQEIANVTLGNYVYEYNGKIFSRTNVLSEYEKVCAIIVHGIDLHLLIAELETLR